MTVDSWGSLIGITFAAIPLAVGLLVVKAVHTLVTRRFFFTRAARGPTRGIEVTSLSLSAAIPVYAFFWWTGFDPDGSTGACTKAENGTRPRFGTFPRGDVRLIEHGLPLSRDCRWADGRHLQLVPLWVNILLFTALAGTLVGLALTARAFTRRPPRPDRTG